MNYKLDDEHLRICVNIDQIYDAVLGTTKELEKMPLYMSWLKRNNADYLYVKSNDNTIHKSLGPRSPETELIYNSYINNRKDLKERLESQSTKLKQYLAQYSALKLPAIASLPAQILRKLDAAGELGTNFIVVGTNAFVAYEIEARERFAFGLDETEDFDLSWCRGSKISFVSQLQDSVQGSPLLDVLKKVDKSFKINNSKPYQALNNKGYEVELLTAPSVMSTLSKDEVFSTAAIPEQEWLLLGKPIRRVVGAKDISPAPLFVPDPRYMALHKLWLSKKDTRRNDKKGKDYKQGELLMDAVIRKMQTSHPVDLDFVLDLPEDLLETFNDWAARHNYDPGNPPELDWF